ncbi:hypothetical protein [Urbifossiella limnaea]|uniref:Uncharacterized protein n=1 Tax=Urbifossiella limnaea TaxID=2528023 RepID=A0A517XRE6_9BACT|nr:hypothetical protein [Urbifossiella limnaea]QDU20053.1 hypothetical protein ETAA1_19960 [Urbifossiella limnaea]
MLRAFGFVMLCLTLVASATRADDAAIKRVVKAKVEELQAATVKGDHAAVIASTYPKLIEQMGGRDKALATVKAGAESFKQKGIEFKAARAGEPADPVKKGGELFVVVPTTTEIASPQGKIVSKGFVVGVSPDDGKSWTFLHGSLDAEKLRKSFPQIPESLVFPKRELKVVDD